MDVVTLVLAKNFTKAQIGTVASGIQKVEYDAETSKIKVTYTNGDTIEYTIPTIVGPQGPQGNPGQDGRGISNAVLNADYTLTLTFTDGTTYTTPSIRGEAGKDGANTVEAGTGIQVDYDSTNKKYTISNTQTSAEWGSITGNIEDQTDLMDTIPEIAANQTDTTTAKLTKLKLNGINYALQGGGASVFVNYQAMITELNSKAKQDLELGWNIYIRTIDVPDLWVSKNDETTSVPYTYVSDAQFISDLRTASTSGLQIGYYRVNQLEAEKVNVPVQDVQIAGTSVLSGGIANIPLAESSNAGVIKVSSGNGVALASGTLVGAVKEYSTYESADNRLMVCKGTLDNVITGKSQSYTCEMASGETKTLTILGSLA